MIIFVLRYSILTVLSLALLACQRHTSVVDNVRQQLRSSASQVNIRQVGDFAWDEMFVFGPYHPKDEICKTLRLSARQCSAAGINDVSEGEFLLVFMLHGEVSQIESFPRTIADFDESERCLGKAIGKAEAVFTVEHKTGRLFLACRPN